MTELDIPIYIHPRSPEADQVRAFDGCDELLGNTWDWGFVTGTLVLRMVFNGVFERFPELKVVIGHMGETIPYCLRRLDEGYECRRLWERKKNQQSTIILFETKLICCDKWRLSTGNNGMCHRSAWY